MELWYFGMSFAGSQYMDGWRDGETSCCLVGCVLQGVIFSDLIKEGVFALRRHCAHRLRGAHLPHHLCR